MEMLQTILIIILLVSWLMVSISALISVIQSIVDSHKREKREQESAKRDLEYHKARMKIYEKKD